MKEFADRLRQFEQNFHLRAADLADALGTSPETVKSWELGMAEPSLAQLRALGIYSERSVDYFLGLDDRVMIDAACLSSESIGILQNYIMFLANCDQEKLLWEKKHAQFIPIPQRKQCEKS